MLVAAWLQWDSEQSSGVWCVIRLGLRVDMREDCSIEPGETDFHIAVFCCNIAFTVLSSFDWCKIQQYVVFNILLSSGLMAPCVMWCVDTEVSGGICCLRRYGSIICRFIVIKTYFA